MKVMVTLGIAAEDLKTGCFCNIGGGGSIPLITYSEDSTASVSLYGVFFGDWAWIYTISDFINNNNKEQ